MRFGVDRTEMLRSMAALMDRLEVLNETMVRCRGRVRVSAGGHLRAR